MVIIVPIFGLTTEEKLKHAQETIVECGGKIGDEEEMALNGAMKFFVNLPDERELSSFKEKMYASGLELF